MGFSDLLPAAVASASTRAARDAPLFPEEARVIARAQPKRRAAFTAARACARTALARLDRDPFPILPGPRGAPVWPDDIVGSLTHSAGFAAAAVARRSDCAAIGIDAEPHAPLPPGLLPLIALPEERAMIAGLRADHPHIAWDRVLFCAKEAAYKAWFPLHRRLLGPEQIVVAMQSGRFQADLDAESSPGFSCAGRWRVAQGMICAAMVVPEMEWRSRQPPRFGPRRREPDAVSTGGMR